MRKSEDARTGETTRPEDNERMEFRRTQNSKEQGDTEVKRMG
jgi:hypothetical protein